MGSTLRGSARALLVRRLLLARIVLCVFFTLCLGAAGAAGASAADGHQEAPGVEVEGREGPEVPGEAEAPPTFAERQQPDQPVTVLHELPELRNEDSDTYLLSNGAYSQRLQNHPINFRAPDGSWQPIDDQLVQQQDGSWSPQASPEPISLPASLGSGPVSVGSGNRRLSFQLEGATQSEGAPAGAQRIYRAALTDTDVTYAATSQAVRETLTLQSADAPTSYRYKLGLADGLHATLQDNGSVLVQDQAGETVYTLAPPSASDSAPERSLPSQSAVHFELSDDGAVLTLVLDQAWLSDPSRVFPVKIDPEVWFNPTDDCSIISASKANTNYCGSHLYVGPENPVSKGVARALLHFDTSSIPKSSVIVASYLRLHYSWDTLGTPITIEAHALEQGFDNHLTWNRYDATHSWATPGGDFKKTVVGERVFNHSEVGQDIKFGMTPQVEQWVRDPESNYGILLKAQNEAKAGFDAFAQSSNGEGEPEPGLEVVYEPRLGIPPMGQVYQQGLANGSTMSVNVANGNLAISAPDVNYATEGYDTELGRTYNSLDDLLVGAAFGTWRLDKGDGPKLYRYDWDGTETFYSPDGGDTRFDRAVWADGHPAAGDKAFTGEAGFNEGLTVHEAGTRTLTFPGGSEWKFENNGWGVATEIVDPGGEGNTLSLSYASLYLTKLKDTHEHTLTLTREETNHNVTKIEGKKGEAWKYAYKEGRLVTVTNPAKEKAKYTYYKSGTASGLMESIDDESGTWVVAYDAEKRVSSLRKLVNGTVKRAGSEDQIMTFSYETEQTTVTNPEGGTGVYYYDQFGNTVEDPSLAEAETEFYSGYEGIETGVAKAGIDLQTHAAILDAQLSQQLGSAYTGEWFEPAANKVAIGITSEGYERTVEQDLDNLGLADNGNITTSASSWSALEAGEDALETKLASLLENGRISLGISPEHDAVLIEQASGLSSGESEQITKAKGELAIASVLATSSETSVGAKEDACRAGACDKPIRAGVRIREPESTEECTAGFVAKAFYEPKYYLLTAGHCIRDSGGVGGGVWKAKYHQLGELEAEANSRTAHLEPLGHPSGYIFGSENAGVGTTTDRGDVGLIELASGNFWGEKHATVPSSPPLAPLAITYGNSELPRNETYGIYGTEYNERSPRYIRVACAGGVSEKNAEGTFLGVPQPGEDCGVMAGVRRIFTYSLALGKPKIYGVFALNVCSSGHPKHLAAGSSGSPVYMAHLAVGIHVGTQGKCVDIYEGINNAENALHVHILR
jgi:hypothetical protein